ncbi:glycosyltransferase family 2 protein, partial [Riemerella anatipestifer]|nr:glycosyltransferase family 2 protein [Riemerella anatipestifer]
MRKDYLLYIWRDKFKRVVEDLQLANAVSWDMKTKGNTKYTLMKDRVMDFTARSSASFNSFNIEDHFDLVRFNYILNELWYEGKFDSYENFPEDFSVDYIYGILLENENKSFADKWKKWTEGFIEMHKSS